MQEEDSSRIKDDQKMAMTFSNYFEALSNFAERNIFPKRYQENN